MLACEIQKSAQCQRQCELFYAQRINVGVWAFKYHAFLSL